MKDLDIDLFIADVQEVGSRIKAIDSLISKITNEELAEHYNKEMLGLIDEYSLMCNLLEWQIDKHLKQERESGNNIENFYYNRVLKSLRGDAPKK